MTTNPGHILYENPSFLTCAAAHPDTQSDVHNLQQLDDAISMLAEEWPEKSLVVATAWSA
jgi:hypothetical protein